MGLLAIIEAVPTGANSGFVWVPGDQWLALFKTTAWSEATVIAISIAVAVTGLALAVFEDRPTRNEQPVFQSTVPRSGC